MKCQKVYWQNVVMAIICLVDMIYTCIVVQSGVAVEANPIMAFFLDKGLLAFIWAKTISFMIPIAIIEGMRPYKNPALISRILTCGIIAYLAVYVIGSLKLL